MCYFNYKNKEYINIRHRIESRKTKLNALGELHKDMPL